MTFLCLLLCSAYPRTSTYWLDCECTIPTVTEHAPFHRRAGLSLQLLLLLAGGHCGTRSDSRKTVSCAFDVPPLAPRKPRVELAWPECRGMKNLGVGLSGKSYIVGLLQPLEVQKFPGGFTVPAMEWGRKGRCLSPAWVLRFWIYINNSPLPPQAAELKGLFSLSS